MQAKILIVGAGPTGLVLALTLDKFNIPFKIIDQKPKPEDISKAMLVVPGTLEHYSQLEILDAVLEEGLELTEGFIHGAKHTKKIFIKDCRSEISRYPKLITYPQDAHERLLVQLLESRGHHIHWDTTFQNLSQTHTKAHVEMKANNAKIKEDFSYVVGADGGSSAVRKALDIAFKGETNEELFFVSDVELENEEFQGEVVHAFMKEEDFLLAFPLKNKTTKRLIGIIPKEVENTSNIQIQDLLPILEERFGLKIAETSWFSEYKIHHRLAEQFRKERVFLAGDAAHIHSPVGGQGMNAGIGDAVNLGWKLAKTLHKKVDSEILNTYEEERREYAEQLVKTTDRFFKLVTANNPIIRRLRANFTPVLANFILTKTDQLSDFIFETIGQTAIQYKHTTLNTKDSRNKLLGSRLPYYKHNLDYIDEMSWQVQIYGRPNLELKHFLDEYGLAYQEFQWEDDMRKAGFIKGAAYFIRPDGYIAWMNRKQDYKSLAAYLRKWKILPDE
jgi:2-polyprenyl-6-methoxyphenol hydroxylase-like FAD-dependent oxidoreductase